MKKKINKREFEEAVNDLDLSLDAKKTFLSQLRLRHESFIFGYIFYALGVLSILGYFRLMYVMREQEFGADIFVLFWVGVFFIAFARFRMNTIKLHRATVELIMETKTANKSSDPT